MAFGCGRRCRDVLRRTCAAPSLSPRTCRAVVRLRARVAGLSPALPARRRVLVWRPMHRPGQAPAVGAGVPRRHHRPGADRGVVDALARCGRGHRHGRGACRRRRGPAARRRRHDARARRSPRASARHRRGPHRRGRSARLPLRARRRAQQRQRPRPGRRRARGGWLRRRPSERPRQRARLCVGGIVEA